MLLSTVQRTHKCEYIFTHDDDLAFRVKGASRDTRSLDRVLTQLLLEYQPAVAGFPWEFGDRMYSGMKSQKPFQTDPVNVLTGFDSGMVLYHHSVVSLFIPYSPRGEGGFQGDWSLCAHFLTLFAPLTFRGAAIRLNAIEYANLVSISNVSPKHRNKKKATRNAEGLIVHDESRHPYEYEMNRPFVAFLAEGLVNPGQRFGRELRQEDVVWEAEKVHDVPTLEEVASGRKPHKFYNRWDVLNRMAEFYDLSHPILANNTWIRNQFKEKEHSPVAELPLFNFQFAEAKTSKSLVYTKKLHQMDKCTLVLFVQDRTQVTWKRVLHYHTHPLLDSIVVIWNSNENVTALVPHVSPFGNATTEIPVHVIQPTAFSPNNRFLAVKEIKTSCVVHLGEDVNVYPEDMTRSIRQFQTSRYDRIIEFGSGEDSGLGKVKNKNAATVQITAEQLLREAQERSSEVAHVPPKQKIADLEELNDYRQKKRKGFEDAIRKNRNHIGTWLKYAAWEESQKELERARSVFERSLDVEHRNQMLWVKYAEMEMKHKNVNMARNIFDRAVAILPRVDLFWYKYTYMEEVIDNVAGCRQVFERWMAWEPSEDAWLAYIKLEKRYNENAKARAVYQRFVSCHPQPKNWLKWSKFEESIGRTDFAREIYESCIETLGEEHVDQNVYISFAKFETRLKEIDRARAIYKYAMSRLAKSKAENLHNVYSQFEKQYGGREGIEDVIVTKRRVKYEEEIAINPNDYDIWFDYTRLEESTSDFPRIRDCYERAIAQVPLTKEKRFWRRYIYLWLFYAVWEEKVAKDFDRTKQIYTQCLNLIPHKQFTFAKVWLNYAKFLIRQEDFGGFRKCLGTSIGMCPKDRLFRGYIELELKLQEVDRVRTLYEKYLTWNSGNSAAWVRFANVEKSVGDMERCRGIFEIAIGQEELEMPEILWKSYIDVEIEEEEYERAKGLYERLLDRSEHVKVWIAYARFEYGNPVNGEEPVDRLEAVRKVFARGYDTLRRKGEKADRAFLVETWREFEKSFGDAEGAKAVEGKVPRMVKKRRKVVGEDGEESGAWEEYNDYLFPDDETERPNLKLFEMAHAWKEKLKMGLVDSDDESDSEDEESENEAPQEQGESSSKRKRDGSDDGEQEDEEDD
ncbi:Crooked neck-like protein 1 [Podochytrium sp. JEL0797]|nr:Crooked neck-like protein 1 [Podochytrium sp. JEL0797]